MAASSPIYTNWSPDKKHADIERYICLYPAYINSKKTRKEGRRLPKDKCVENPTYSEIGDVLSVSNLRVVVQNKQYPREKSKELQFRGRIRVQMRNNDGTPCNPELGSRDVILEYIAGKIPQLKSRQNKTSDSYQAAAPAPAQQHHSSGGGGGGGGGHKKGKGKRR